VIAALLLLALGFAGYWIVNYLQTGGAPWSALPWFGAAAAVIVVVGFVAGFLLERMSGRS
jgi:predicted ABC-type exoprotein transport system permease subunit